jgi:hypothetical protein
VGSNERSGLPLKGREAAIAGVWVDLRALFPPAAGRQVPDGLVLEVVPGGLQKWIRGADGQWIGVVTYVARRTDGSTYKAADQLVPANALRPR